MERAYRHSTRIFSLLILILGVAMMATTLVRGGGPLAIGVVGGFLFAALGAGRLYIAGADRDRRDT